MKLDAIPLFSALQSKLGYLGQRQQLIASNVAHASTPGYTPQDLKPFKIGGTRAPTTAGVGVAQTHSAHLSGSLRTVTSTGYKAAAAPDSETTLDGNRVVLEEQMLKMTEARLEHDAAIGFYQKSLNILRMASRPPGRGA